MLLMKLTSPERVNKAEWKEFYGPLDQSFPFFMSCGVKEPPPPSRAWMFQIFDSLQASKHSQALGFDLTFPLLLLTKDSFFRCTPSDTLCCTWSPQKEPNIWILCPSGAQQVGVGFLQAQRAVVRKRMAVIVFNQSCQVREGHLIVQKNQAILPKHIM